MSLYDHHDKLNILYLFMFNIQSSDFMSTIVSYFFTEMLFYLATIFGIGGHLDFFLRMRHRCVKLYMIVYYYINFQLFLLMYTAAIAISYIQ